MASLTWVLVRLKTPSTDVRLLYCRYPTSKIRYLYIRFIVHLAHYYQIDFLWQVGSDQDCWHVYISTRHHRQRALQTFYFVSWSTQVRVPVSLSARLLVYAFDTLCLDLNLVSLSPCRHVVLELEAWLCMRGGSRGGGHIWGRWGAASYHHKVAGKKVTEINNLICFVQAFINWNLTQIIPCICIFLAGHNKWDKSVCFTKNKLKWQSGMCVCVWLCRLLSRLNHLACKTV